MFILKKCLSKDKKNGIRLVKTLLTNKKNNLMNDTFFRAIIQHNKKKRIITHFPLNILFIMMMTKFISLMQFRILILNYSLF